LNFQGIQSSLKELQFSCSYVSLEKSRYDKLVEKKESIEAGFPEDELP